MRSAVQLPAIPDNKNFEILLNSLNIENMYSKYVNAIPDNTSMEYEKITNNWEITNPHGYYLWFNERMNLMRKAFYESATIEEIPEYKRKTILLKLKLLTILIEKLLYQIIHSAVDLLFFENELFEFLLFSLFLEKIGLFVVYFPFEFLRLFIWSNGI